MSKGGNLDVHVEIDERVLDWHAHYFDFAADSKFGEIFRRQSIGHVSVTFLEQGTPCARGRNLAHDHALERRQFALRPAVEAGEDQLLSRIPGFDLESTAASLVALQPFLRPGVLVGGMGLCQL